MWVMGWCGVVWRKPIADCRTSFQSNGMCEVVLVVSGCSDNNQLCMEMVAVFGVFVCGV